MSYSNMCKLTLFIFMLALSTMFASDAPNIVYVMLDDVGWSDLGRNVADSPIPTPFIDQLTAQGVHLTQHYVHSVCSPTRAALLTGRYHVNTGMTNVLIPGTPAGLPADIPTLPSLLSCLGGYSTAMAGKWHLGHAQHRMTPIGRGFDRFTGMYMWDIDSYTKQWYEVPWEAPLMLDWVQEERHSSRRVNHQLINASQCENRPYTYTYKHYAEPRHATEAITAIAEGYIQQHSQKNNQVTKNEQSPLFLYVAYTAAHSPLQPLPRHVAHCTHLPHGRRRDYCGMIVGLDEGLRNLTQSMQQHLGKNTILVVASDNGGAAYFGGMNAPLRGQKGTPFEGGVRVPAFIVDYTQDQRYLGPAVPAPARSLAPRETANDGLESTHLESVDFIDLDKMEVTPTGESVPRQNTENFEQNDRIKEWHHKRLAANVSYSRVFPGMMHVSDWLPTLLTYAQVPAEKFPAKLDGIDFTAALRSAAFSEAKSNANMCTAPDPSLNNAVSPRNGFLVEMYYANESVFNQTLVAYRLGDYKLIQGSVRDLNYYYESSNNRVNSSHLSLGTYLAESIIEWQDYLFGKGPSDTLNIVVIHMLMFDWVAVADAIYPLRQSSALHAGPHSVAQRERDTTLRLYNIIQDPCEAFNLAEDPAYASIIAAIQAELDLVASHRPPLLPLDLQIDISHGSAWSKSHVPGDCSTNPNIKPEHCRFTHSWVADDADPMQQEGLMNAKEYLTKRLLKQAQYAGRFVLVVAGIIGMGRVLTKSR